MKKIMLVLALPLALTACPGPFTATAPAPLQQTVIDEQGLKTVWRAFDTALTLSDTVVAVKPGFAGSPLAKKIAGHFRTAQKALNAATAAQKAGSTTDYVKALTEAREALSLAAEAYKGI